MALTSNPYDRGLENIANLCEYWANTQEQARNEATTRLQLVDQLFFDCLNWSKYEDVLVEDPHDGKYLDYAFLGANRNRIMIVEAKKEGIDFSIPIGSDNLEYAISSLTHSNPNLTQAMKQVAGYCQSTGVEIGVATNGHQIVAFIAARNDGISPMKGKAIVFPSLEYMYTHFLDLWNLLSKDAVIQRSLYSRLTEKTVALPPSKLSIRLSNYPGIKNRNPFQTDLQILADFVLEDFADRNDLGGRFLRECYSPSGALPQYSHASKVMLRSRYTALFGEMETNLSLMPATDKKGISDDLLAETISRRPIILIGDVGVGKTTFIQYLRKVEAVPEFEKAITIYLDLGSQAVLSSNLNEFILNEIEQQLLSEYQIDIYERKFVRAIYHNELIRWQKSEAGGLKDSHPDQYVLRETDFIEGKTKLKDIHLKYVFQHISKSYQKQIVIFVDNADQRNETTQQEAFLIAQEFAKQWQAAVFISLRPETFYNSSRKGALTGYHAKAFTISPPRVSLVIEKRIEFALKIARGEIKPQTFSQAISLKLPSLEIILQIFLESLEENVALNELIENICGGDVRLALDLVRGFFGSGHVDTQKFIDSYEAQSKYTIPLHEFMRAMIFGDAKYYNPSRSPVVNIFDVSFANPNEHFLLSILIEILSFFGESGQQGFVETSLVYEELQQLGFTPKQIDAAIARSLEVYRNRLIETETRLIPIAGEPMPQVLRTTSVGLYHVRSLPKYFAYVDAMIIDTPIFDNNIRQQITDAELIEDRLNRIVTFRRYLDNQWHSFKTAHPKVTSFYDWKDISKSLERDIDNAWKGHNKRLV